MSLASRGSIVDILGDDVFTDIAKRLPTRSVAQLASTCSRMNNICRAACGDLMQAALLNAQIDASVRLLDGSHVCFTDAQNIRWFNSNARRVMLPQIRDDDSEYGDHDTLIELTALTDGVKSRLTAFDEHGLKAYVDHVSTSMEDAHVLERHNAKDEERGWVTHESEDSNDEGRSDSDDSLLDDGQGYYDDDPVEQEFQQRAFGDDYQPFDESQGFFDLYDRDKHINAAIDEDAAYEWAQYRCAKYAALKRWDVDKRFYRYADVSVTAFYADLINRAAYKLLIKTGAITTTNGKWSRFALQEAKIKMRRYRRVYGKRHRYIQRLMRLGKRAKAQWFMENFVTPKSRLVERHLYRGSINMR